MKREEQFRSSDHQIALATFLESPTGKELLSLLEKNSRPNKRASEQYGTHEDVKFQMAINFVASNERFSVIDEIRKLTLPLNNGDGSIYEPLEPDNEYSPKKKKKHLNK